ncbi:uncharacterized protein MONOS_17218 [Monocercomonoides exilis]|uniref:uncharacterized protein n=1 Tax=Monocercomonoides exilis TaxID=2049356 RepID=UPI00355A889A|nr:hypothetical protein MONOS_17218 [Monocercomonoides exilis]
MKIIDSAISHWGWSIRSGKGGGAYLATKERGILDYAFMGMKFSANTAKVGNDVFIECHHISSQIKESQFHADIHFPCSTLIYAGTNVLGTSPATLKLVDGSSIFDEMTLNTQEMNIDGDISKAKIRISKGGENVFLIKGIG